MEDEGTGEGLAGDRCLRVTDANWAWRLDGLLATALGLGLAALGLVAACPGGTSILEGRVAEAVKEAVEKEDCRIILLGPCTTQQLGSGDNAVCTSQPTCNKGCEDLRWLQLPLRNLLMCSKIAD